MRNAMSRILLLLLAIILSAPFSDGSSARPRKNRKDTAAVPAVSKSPYEKFISGRNIVKESGFVTVYRDGDDIWLEIPDSVLGRRIILSTMVRKSSSRDLASGIDVSSNPVYRIEKTDSLVIFTTDPGNFVVSDGDPDIASALEKSKSAPVLYTMPVKYRNADSTAVVVKATDLFDVSDKDVVDFKGHPYGDATIYSMDIKSSLSRMTGIYSFGRSVGVGREFSGTLTLASVFGELSEKPEVTVETMTLLTILPEKNVQKRKADSRIGTARVSFSSYSSTGEVERDWWAARWDVSDGIRIYVDTLLPASWISAVKSGIEEWNKAFRAAGRGDVIEVLPYPSSGKFYPEDPAVSVVTIGGSAGQDITATRLVDRPSAEIVSCRINIPMDYVTGVRRASIYAISDVDPRYQQYELPDDAVCEVLKAQMMSIFGKCLGLSANLAGSAAYSPEQLRDPDFTSRNGITSSVTDGVLFNYMTEPGDRERGVVTVVDRLGAYDMYAVEWLYGSFEGDEEQALDSLVSSKAGQAEFLYAGSQTGNALRDPRASAVDLGNDVFAAYDAGMRHVRFVAENADKWLGDDIPQPYMDLFIDFLWLRFNSLSSMLAGYIGGCEINDVREGAVDGKLVPVPASVQKKAIEKYLAGYSDLSWFDRNRNLLFTAGPNRDVTAFSIMNGYNLLGMPKKLSAVSMSYRSAGGDYSPEKFLSDMQNAVLRNLRKGTLAPGEDVLVASYIVSLISVSDVMKQNYKETTDGGSAAYAVPSVESVPVAYTDNLDELCYSSLKKARNIIASSRNRFRNDTDRRKIDYLVYLADAGLGSR